VIGPIIDQGEFDDWEKKYDAATDMNK